MKSLATGLVLWLLLGGLAPAAEPTLENDTLCVGVDAAHGTFSLRLKSSGKVIVPRGTLGGSGGALQVAAASDPHFGQGQQIIITYPSGNRDTIAVYPGLPFALFRATLHNGGKEPRVVKQLRPLAAEVDLGVSAGSLRTLGTGGLLTPEKNPGSYAFLAVADPATRAGVVAAWLTHDRGSGVVFSPVAGDTVRIEAQIDYGRLRLRPGGDAEAETFVLGAFPDARLGLEAYAEAVARHYAIKLPPQPAGYCTWYADKHGGACDETHLALLAEFAAKELKPFGFEFVQIDDHWQAGVSRNGPRRNFTTHDPKGPYPGGMKATAERIQRLGLTPGIWFMPFAGTHYDPLFADHQEWFAKTEDGKPFKAKWGGTCLDMTQPAAREYVRSVVDRLARQWGFRLFKMDGLWTGTATPLMYVNNGYRYDNMDQTVLHDADKTPIEAYRDGLKLVRQTAGPDVFLLGCCVSQNMRSFGGAFGLLDAMRIGPDTGSGQIGAPHGSRTWFLHGRVWQNDPDCVAVRASMPLDQARVNATWTAISGQLFYDSDWLPELPAERLEILKRTMPAHGLPARPVDVFENEPARIWLLSDTRRTPRRDVVACYNWDPARSVQVTCQAARLGLPPAKAYAAFDFWANKFVPLQGPTLSVELPPASCRVLAVRPAADHPQLLSTSRHVTQGIVDVLEETWDAASTTLRGTSRLVGNDPYELRILVPVGERSWRGRAVTVSATEAAAGVKAELRQDGPKLRATLMAPQSGEVHWQVQFAPAPVTVAAPAAVTGLKAAVQYSAVTLSWEDKDADAYRVTRSDGTTFTCTAARLQDTSPEHGRTYRYAVQAVGWDGALSQPAEVQVATPAELKRPPTPPVPDVHLCDLKPMTAKNGYGKLGINVSATGKPLSVQGKQYARGLGSHAHALLIYNIPAGAKKFVAVVGLDDAQIKDPRGSVTFEVYGDVQEMGEPPVLLAESPPITSPGIHSWAFHCDLTPRMKQLRLVVTDAGDGIHCDHADWVDAGFVVK